MSRSLLDLSYEDLVTQLEALGEPAYRAGQIWRAVYKELLPDYGAITTLPASLRERLAALYPLSLPQEVDLLLSGDGRTRKALTQLADGERIETVTMDYEQRHTVCVSSQVGCAMACQLCATGLAGFRRDLSAGEIIAQVLDAARWFAAHGDRVTNIVYMGMGEPLANYDATLTSIRRLNDERGLHLGARSFTISTVGIIPGIDRLASEGLQVNLAVSLHAADDAIRSTLVPVNRRHPLSELIAACRRYIEATNRRVTFEIALIAGVNDRPEDAAHAARLLSGLLCHVNVIPFNRVAGTPWQGSSRERVQAFVDVLKASRIPTSVRVSRGADIQAGCGQLRARQGAGKEPGSATR